MYLIKPLLLLLSSLVFANGYSLPGGYERMMLYYAYLMDCALTDNKPETIASTCKGAGGGPCNLNELIEHVSKTKLTNVDVTSVRFPNVPPLESTAQEIVRKDFAGAIDVGVANHAAGRGASYDKFLAKTGEFLAGKMASGKISQELKDAARNSISSVLRSRIEASTRVFFEDNPTLTEKTKEMPLYEGSEEKVQVLDGKETAKASGKTTKEVGALWKENIKGNHGENIKILQNNLQKADWAC